MTDRCSHCPCPLDLVCEHSQPFICEWAATGDPVKLLHIVNRSRLLAGSRPIQSAATVAAVPRPTGLAREIVVARYQEDLGWLDDAKDFVSVYDKGGGLYGLTIPHAYTFLENNGREAGTILSHIVRYYDDLATRTYFVQGDGLTHDPDLLDRIAYPFEKPTPLCRHYTATFPPSAIKDTDRIETIGPFEVHFGNALADRQGRNEDGRSWFNPAAWTKVFTAPQPDPLWFGYAATWAVPKESIRHRSRECWQWLLAQVMQAQHEEDVWGDQHPLTAWAMEALWGYLWDPEYPTKPLIPQVITGGQLIKQKMAEGLTADQARAEVLKFVEEQRKRMAKGCGGCGNR